jgi:hypothetical protein
MHPTPPQCPKLNYYNLKTQGFLVALLKPHTYTAREIV